MISQVDFVGIFLKVFAPWIHNIGVAAIVVLTFFFALLHYAFLKYRINLRRINAKELSKKRIKLQLLDFIRWLVIDLMRLKRDGLEFKLFGFTIFVGRQGAGKTISLIEYLNRMHEKYPKALIVTNFKYEHATHRMDTWKDFFEIRNGIDGVIFAIDEVHSEFSTVQSKSFPEAMLSEISQQRKQRIKIVCTAQQYARVAKPIRDQAATVVQCMTIANRWTFSKEYDAVDYETLNSVADIKKRKIKPISRHSFVQSDELRNCYDTYEKIERLAGREFLDRKEY